MRRGSLVAKAVLALTLAGCAAPGRRRNRRLPARATCHRAPRRPTTRSGCSTSPATTCRPSWVRSSGSAATAPSRHQPPTSRAPRALLGGPGRGPDGRLGAHDRRRTDRGLGHRRGARQQIPLRRPGVRPRRRGARGTTRPTWSACPSRTAHWTIIADLTFADDAGTGTYYWRVNLSGTPGTLSLRPRRVGLLEDLVERAPLVAIDPVEHVVGVSARCVVGDERTAQLAAIRCSRPARAGRGARRP